MHYEGLKKENDILIGKINAIRATQAEQEPKIAKVIDTSCPWQCGFAYSTFHK